MLEDLWSAPAERSGDGALAPWFQVAPFIQSCNDASKAASRCACRRTPYLSLQTFQFEIPPPFPSLKGNEFIELPRAARDAG
jgi:hypothetical protein